MPAFAICTRAAGHRTQPADHLGQLALTVARDARRSPRSRPNAPPATAHAARAAVCRSRPPPSSSINRTSPIWAGGFSTRNSTSRPTIRLASCGLVMPAAGTVATYLPVAQHRDAVGNGQHLVQLVTDEDDRLARCGHLAQRVEKGFGFLGRQDRGRLVQNENLRAAIEQLDDLDPLLLAHGKLPDLRPRVHGQTELVGRCARPSASISARVEQPRHVGQPQNDVLRHASAKRPA